MKFSLILVEIYIKNIIHSILINTYGNMQPFRDQNRHTIHFKKYIYRTYHFFRTLSFPELFRIRQSFPVNFRPIMCKVCYEWLKISVFTPTIRSYMTRRTNEHETHHRTKNASNYSLATSFSYRARKFLKREETK